MPMTVRACPMMVSTMMSLPPAMTVPAGPPRLAESAAKIPALACHLLQTVASLATVLAAGLRPDLPEKERLALYSGHSLRAGLASSAEVDERYVQKHLGHASAEMTRRYQRRRDRFRVNLTKAAGL